MAVSVVLAHGVILLENLVEVIANQERTDQVV